MAISPTQTSSESDLQNRAIIEISSKLSGIVTIWRNNTGAAMLKDRFVRFGLKGQGDASGLMKPYGRRLELEFKAPGKKQRPDQKLFQAMIEAHGGLYFLIDNWEKVMVCIETIRAVAERDARVVR